MKRAAPVLVLGLGLVLGIWWAQRSRNRPPTDKETNAEHEGGIVATGVVVTASSPPTPSSSNQIAPLIGENILRDYAKTNLPPENDLTLISRLMDNFLLLVKTAKDRPLSVNEDWAAAFRGRNPAQERFLPDQHIALSASGQLVDRWGTPLFFHALGGGRFELRSAGPDKKLWTEDDIHRNADGSFRRGDKLNPRSLFPESARP